MKIENIRDEINGKDETIKFPIDLSEITFLIDTTSQTFRMDHFDQHRLIFQLILFKQRICKTTEKNDFICCFVIQFAVILPTSTHIHGHFLTITI